jgi:hypothetical protein
LTAALEASKALKDLEAFEQSFLSFQSKLFAFLPNESLRFEAFY